MVNPLSNPIYLLSPLIVGLVSLSLAVVVWRGAPQGPSKWIFCGFLVSLAVWSLFLFPMRSSPNVDLALIWDRPLGVLAYTTYLLYFHFTVTYTNAKRQRGILIAAYLLLVVIAILSPTDLMVQGMRLEYYGYAPVTGPAAYLLSVGVLALLGGGAYNLIRRYRVTSSYEERNRLLYLLIAVLFPVVGGLLDAFSNLPPLTIWSNLLFCVICSIALLKYHLLDIRVIIRKSIIYLIVSIAVALPYVAALYLLNHVFKYAVEPWWIHVFIVLALAVALRPLYSWAQNLVDRLFYRDRYDYLKSLEQFSLDVQRITDFEELCSGMVNLVSGALRTSTVFLLLPDQWRRGFILASSTGLENHPDDIILRKNSPLVRRLALQVDILQSDDFDIVPQLQSFSAREKNRLEQMGARLYVPLRTPQGDLAGIMVLGERPSQQPYSHEDKQLLRAVSNQMAVKLENAQLYAASRQEVAIRRKVEEELTKSREQLRNLSAHLELAREEERTSIAREIHDELGQSLTALKMDVSWLSKKLPSDMESLRGKTKEMIELIDGTIQTVKRISTELRPGLLDDLGLTAATEWQAHEFQNRTGIKCKLVQNFEDQNLDRELATAVFRILQETLTNVARHAKATGVKVSLRKKADSLVLQVRDNGIGIKRDQLANPGSFGLIGIRERARSRGGEAKISGVEGKGTVVTVTMPLDRRDEKGDKYTGS